MYEEKSLNPFIYWKLKIKLENGCSTNPLTHMVVVRCSYWKPLMHVTVKSEHFLKQV